MTIMDHITVFPILAATCETLRNGTAWRNLRCCSLGFHSSGQREILDRALKCPDTTSRQP